MIYFTQNGRMQSFTNNIRKDMKDKISKQHKIPRDELLVKN